MGRQVKMFAHVGTLDSAHYDRSVVGIAKSFAQKSNKISIELCDYLRFFTFPKISTWNCSVSTKFLRRGLSQNFKVVLLSICPKWWFKLYSRFTLHHTQINGNIQEVDST